MGSREAAWGISGLAKGPDHTVLTLMHQNRKGPPILMVHGFPRTSLMWRFLAPKLAESHTVICVDLRAYGQSGIPASADDWSAQDSADTPLRAPCIGLEGLRANASEMK